MGQFAVRTGAECYTGAPPGGGCTIRWARRQARRIGGDPAQLQLEQVLQIVDARGERIYLLQLLLIEAAIARARAQLAAALDTARRAIDEARAQQAPWLELLARVDLCAHDGADAEDRRALAAPVDALPEAGDTAAVAAARAAGRHRLGRRRHRADRRPRLRRAGRDGRCQRADQ